MPERKKNATDGTQATDASRPLPRSRPSHEGFMPPHGGYEKGKEVVSFCGYLPAENPQFVGLVVLDDAQTKPEQNYGGLVAGPIFSHIAEKAARYLDLEPHEEIRKATPVVRVALTNSSRH